MFLSDSLKISYLVSDVSLSFCVEQRNGGRDSGYPYFG